LAAYEAGVLWLGGAQPEGLRNGADTWLRWGLERFGLPQFYCAPALIIVVFLGWSLLRWYDRPGRVRVVGMGMAVESVVFALGLWALSCQLQPLLDGLGIRLRTPGQNPYKPEAPAKGSACFAGASGLGEVCPGVLNTGLHSKGIRQIVTFVGAGIYEEVLFRLLLFFGLGCLLRLIGFSTLLSALFCTLASAFLFSAAHHIGPYGEAFDRYVFLFRSLAGFYFALLYQFRGFGIAVGSHACYDVLVGVLMV
jgi:membrane protease YdiL (CAAX protease family)